MTSSAESANATPNQETAEQLKLKALERVEESVAPALGLSRLIATDHMNKMFAGARRRLEDSHKSQMLKLQEVTGNQFDLTEDTEGEEVAISVAGDTNNYTTPGSSLPAWASGLIGAGLAASGLAAYSALNQPSDYTPRPTPQTPITAEDRDTYVPYSLAIE